MKTNHFYLAAMVALGIGSATFASAENRVWTDDTGTYEVEAEFVSLKEDSVTLKKSTGEVITIPMTRLSPADQEYAKEAAVAVPQNYEASGTTNITYKSGKTQYYNLTTIIDLEGGVAADVYALGSWDIEPVTVGDREAEAEAPFFGNKFNLLDRTGQSFIRQSDHPEDGIRFRLDFGKIKKETTEIGPVKGSIHVWLGGEAKSVTIDNMLDHPNGLIEDPALTDVGLELYYERSAEGDRERVAVSGGRDGVTGFAGLEILTAEGERDTSLKRPLILGLDERQAWGVIHATRSELEGKKLRIHFRDGARKAKLHFEVKGIEVDWTGWKR